MRNTNHDQVLQKAGRRIIFLIIFVLLQLKVVCFLQPDSPTDETYIGFTVEATNFTPAQEYDYIIIGGGTAGCPLAAALSQSYSVLLLERGGVAGSDPNILYENNALNPILTADLNDSPAQNFFSEDGVFNTRGRVLGGSSMINFGFYSRADDYFYQNSGIDFGDMSDVERAYEWVENRIVTRTNGLRKWQASTFDALLQAGVSPNNGFTADHVIGTKVGGSTFDDLGRRHGAVELLNKANPTNLKVVVHATVDRIIFSTSASLGAIGVTYHDTKGTSHQVHIRPGGEVILSSGAIGSPQLLLVSGIGPTLSLSSLNIPVIRDQPLVGQFMADNPRNGINLLVPLRLDDVGVRVAGITKTGPYVESTAVPRLTSSVPFIPFSNLIPPSNLSVVVLGGKVSRPLSTGSLNLLSSDVTISPRVKFNYFSQPEDLVQCGNLVEVLRKMLGTQALEEYKFPGILGPDRFIYIGPSLPISSSDNESIASFCRKTLSTFWHAHGGCLVNKVVDKDLKVIGVDSLRVVDASTFFNSPGTNPQATIMMLGRYIGMKILNERGANGINS